ncbi:MAG: hypothetical protein HQ567_28795 [Candidatus Nealsonbacteria bacterium]|nr:hypothetical protein [Candidatus Nealsonbacteria bacterium]
MSSRPTRRTALIVTVDTEEEGLWGGTYRTTGNTVENTRGIVRFQELCDRFEIRPTYVIDTPVVEDDRSVETLKGLQDSDRCEIGAHLHPWCAPPFEEELNGHNSYTCNLPEPLQREKLARLTDRIEQRFARRPTSFRAGRYGLDIVGARILEDLGYLVDSSVICFHDYSAEGGPDFHSAPYKPYRIGKEDLRLPDDIGRLLEVPVSVGFSWSKFAWAQRIRQFAMRPALQPFRLVGILDRLNLVRRIKFGPEQSDAARMKQLADAYLANAAPCMVMLLHSSSLMPGHSPYAPSEAALEQMYDEMETTFEYCRRRLAMESATLTEFAESSTEDQP